MERVGHHLQLHAIGLPASEERDLFGRSAYNRYYYAAFLRARNMMIVLDNQWSRLPHKGYPELLRGTIKKDLMRGKQKARKIGDADAISVFSRAITAATEIATLMENASSIRVVADYNPQIPILFGSGGRFSLNNVDITTAHQWVEKVNTWADAVERAWSQLNV